MGANEKFDAAMHGALSEVRMNDDVTRIKHTYADAMRAKTGVGTATFDAEFDRFIAKIKAEAWDACARSIVYEDGTPVQIMSITNPYKEAPNA